MAAPDLVKELSEGIIELDCAILFSYEQKELRLLARHSPEQKDPVYPCERIPQLWAQANPKYAEPQNKPLYLSARQLQKESDHNTPCALAALPLIYEDKLLGMLVAYSYKKNTIRPSLRTFLESLATNIAESSRRLQYEKRLKIALENSYDGIWEWSPATGEAYFGPRYLRMLGYEPDELPNNYKTWFSLLHPEDRDRVSALVQSHIAQSDAPFDLEFRMQNKNGEYVWVYSRGQVMERNPDGEAQYVVGTHIDITENKHLAQFSKTIIDSSPVAIVLYHANGHCVLANLAAADLVGVDLSILYQQNFRELTSWQDSGLLDLALQVLENKQKQNQILKLTTSAGRQVWLHITLQSVINNAGPHLLVIAQDLTEIKTSQQRLQEYADKLQRSNHELEQFAYIASHDLQEPLRSIISFNQILQEEYTHHLDPQALEYFRLVTNSAQHMQRLIQDLLDYSRLGTQGSSPTWFNAAELIPKIEGYLHSQINMRSGQIHWSLPPERQNELFVYGDSQQLGQILYNLISNGLKYNESEPPVITIAIEVRELDWCITVADNGIGISPKQRERVFRMFQRLHPRQKYPGTGIGLAMVHKIIQLHGGSIHIEDNDPQGSRFIFTLPKPTTE